MISSFLHKILGWKVSTPILTPPLQGRRDRGKATSYPGKREVTRSEISECTSPPLAGGEGRDSKLNILHLVAIRGKGGTGASTLSLVEGLANRGHRVAVVCFKRGLLYKSLQDKGRVELITGIKMATGFKPQHWYRDLKGLLPFVKGFKPHIIHTHSSPDYWLGFLLSLLTGTPLVRTRHVPVPLKPHPLNLFLYKKTAAVIAVSHTIRHHYFSSNSWDASRLKVIYDGVDFNRFHGGLSGEKIREELGVKNHEMLVGSVARYSWVKGLSYFLEALAQVMEENSLVKGLVVGRIKDKKVYQQLRDWVKKRRLEERIYLLGYRQEVEEILAALDVMVLASLGSEGSSRVVMEAGAMGKPVVGTRVGALPEMILDGETGFLVPPGDPQAMALVLKVLLSERVRQEMGRNSILWIQGNFDGRDRSEKVERLYRGIVGQKTL